MKSSALDVKSEHNIPKKHELMEKVAGLERKKLKLLFEQQMFLSQC